MEELKVNIDGKEHIVNVEESEGHLKIHLDGNVYQVDTSLKDEQKDIDLSSGSKETKSGEVKADISGIIYSVDVKKGQQVKKGQKIISLIAMKMENRVLSPTDGKVKDIKVKKNDKVKKGDILVVIE
jgi:biotin carboxyl carrier protein